ncbi:MAG: AAA family ATPase, partial [Candidatus Aminicenantes bacterium]|nr:AAA family ATPase [Candidatus Aminicenantes bacterium]
KQNPRDGYHLKAIDNADLVFMFSESNSTREHIAKNVFAYGVHRTRNDSDKADEYGYLTLFQEDQYLKNPVKWLQYLHHKEKAKEKPPIDLKAAINMLKSLLSQNVEISVTPDAVTFTERQTGVKFSQLADGYKSVITWACDLLERLSKNQPGAERTEDFKGIVLLDEIELFLHPRWKYKIVRDLRRWFPGIQFVFTTHSPTVILGASKDAVFYKLYKEDGVTKVSRPVSKISNLMLNAIITSPLFDLESAQAFGFAQDVPEQLESAVFKKEILDRIVDNSDRNFITGIYSKSRNGNGGTTYVLNDNLDLKKIDRLLKILIGIGFKEKLDTSSD